MRIYTLYIKKDKDSYMPLMRGNLVAGFDNLFALRKYFRAYDKSLLKVEYRESV
jgi:hypothetical protein